MAESTLTLTRSRLRAEIGFFLGYGRGSDYGNTAWDDDSANAIDSCLDSGLRRFYYPPQPSGFYDWSFLRPISVQHLDSGATSLTLPDDFGGIEGAITCATVGTGTGIVWWPLLTCNESAVRQELATFPTITGRPQKAAVVPLRGTDQNSGQRFQLAVYPTADQQYQLKFSYTLQTGALTSNAPIPYGGALHAETILESCLAVAEERLDNEQTVHKAAFDRLLIASMAQDRRMKPQQMGYNADYSDIRGASWNPYANYSFPAVTYNGQPF